MIPLHRTHRFKLITAHPRFISQDGPLYRLAMSNHAGPEEHKLHAAFARLYPSAFVQIEPLGGTAFALTSHAIGTTESYCAARCEVSFASPQQRQEFETRIDLVRFASRLIDANMARLDTLGRCNISHSVGLDGQSGVIHFYSPMRTREENEARFPEFARHNAQMATYHHAYAEELFKRPECPTSAYRYNVAIVEKYGGLATGAAHCSERLALRGMRRRLLQQRGFLLARENLRFLRLFRVPLQLLRRARPSPRRHPLMRRGSAVRNTGASTRRAFYMGNRCGRGTPNLQSSLRYTFRQRSNFGSLDTEINHGKAHF